VVSGQSSRVQSSDVMAGAGRPARIDDNVVSRRTPNTSRDSAPMHSHRPAVRRSTRHRDTLRDTQTHTEREREMDGQTDC